MTGEKIASAINEYVETLDAKDYGAINQADFACTEVRKVNRLYPTPSVFLEAILEEADPENYKLCDDIFVQSPG